MESIVCVVTLLCVIVTCAASDEPHVTFDVIEDLPETFVGSIPQSEYVRVNYDVTVVSGMTFQLVATATGVEVSFSLDADTGVLLSGSSGVDREAHCAGQEVCHVTLQVALVSDNKWLQVNRVIIAHLLHAKTSYLPSTYDPTYDVFAFSINAHRINSN